MCSRPTSPSAFLHPSLCCFLTCAVPYPLPCCPAISSQRCCLKSSREQSRDTPRAQGRAQDSKHLVRAFTAHPPGDSRFCPWWGRFLFFPSLSLTEHEENSAVQPCPAAGTWGIPPDSAPAPQNRGASPEDAPAASQIPACQHQQAL